jgi:hypothetical protein
MNIHLSGQKHDCDTYEVFKPKHLMKEEKEAINR